MLGMALIACAQGQSTASDLQARLLKKTLYLRGFYAENKLRFDGQGVVEGSPAVGTFTLAGVAVDRVELSSDSLRLRGHRMALTFPKEQPVWIPMRQASRYGLGTHPEEMQIVVERPASGDYAQALNTVFATELGELVPLLPQEWHAYGRTHFLHEPPPAAIEPQIQVAKLGWGGSGPEVLHRTEPDFSQAARAMRAGGNVFLSIKVDDKGKLYDVSVTKPAGLGLDEQSVRCVKQWTFQSAMLNGIPVPVQLEIEVVFQVF